MNNDRFGRWAPEVLRRLAARDASTDNSGSSALVVLHRLLTEPYMERAWRAVSMLSKDRHAERASTGAHGAALPIEYEIWLDVRELLKRVDEARKRGEADHRERLRALAGELRATASAVDANETLGAANSTLPATTLLSRPEALAYEIDGCAAQPAVTDLMRMLASHADDLARRPAREVQPGEVNITAMVVVALDWDLQRYFGSRQMPLVCAFAAAVLGEHEPLPADHVRPRLRARKARSARAEKGRKSSA